MNALLRLAASTSFALSMGAVAFGQHYVQTNLDANAAGAAEATDSQLVNPWGLTRSSGSTWWVADNLTGVSTLYNGAGQKQSLVVTIPPADPNNKKTPTGSPTGAVSNGSNTTFLLDPKDPARFIFATVDGTIAAWNPNVAIARGAVGPSTHAVTVVKTNDGSSYTGLTLGFIDGEPYLYAANFTKGRVDVYDSSFHRVHLRDKQRERDEDQGDDRSYGDSDDNDRYSSEDRPFVDERLPRDFVPFNVQAIGKDIAVTYVLHQEGSPFETDGPGLGYVDIYSSTGRLLRRLEHGNFLNAPWGVALAPLDFGRFSHDLLVGQFAGAGTTESSGYIVAYDLTTGKFDGLLQDASGKPLSISGVWALSPANVSPSSADPDEAPAAEIYFTAAPNQGSGGLFGYLTAVPAELTEGGRSVSSAVSSKLQGGMRYPTLHFSSQLWTFGPHEASVGCGPTPPAMPILRNRLQSLPRDCLILHYAGVAKGRKPGDFYGQWNFFGWSGVKQIIRFTPQAQKYRREHGKSRIRSSITVFHEKMPTHGNYEEKDRCMNTCDKHSANILRCLDNELSGQDLRDFRNHLASCSSCAAHLEDERELSLLFQRSRPLYSASAALRARVSWAVIQERSVTNHALDRDRNGVSQFPKSLLNIVSLPWSLSWKLAPALLAVVVCLVFIPNGVRQVHAADYVETAVDTHRSYVDGNLPIGIETDSPDKVTEWISGKVPFQFRLPSSDLTPQSKPLYRLTGASVVNYKGSTAALITYATKKEKISLLVASSKSAVVAGGDEVRAGALTFHYRSHHGYKVITWSNHDLSYALVSSVSGSARGSCLVCHQNMADHDAFTPPR